MNLLQIPSLCYVCGCWHRTLNGGGAWATTGAWCQACEDDLIQATDRCRQCACGLADGAAATRCITCLCTPPLWHLGAAAVAYVYPWSDLIKRFKYRGESHLASSLAGLMLRSADIKTLLLAADIWIPVPLTTNKLLARGFNQASHLANALRRQLNAAAPVAIATLCRTRETRPQEGLDRAARVRNVANAFVVDGQDKRRITGRHVLLIDDVGTTGATLNAACKALHAQGVASINTVVFARTPAAGG